MSDLDIWMNASSNIYQMIFCQLMVGLGRTVRRGGGLSLCAASLRKKYQMCVLDMSPWSQLSPPRHDSHYMRKAHTSRA